MSDIADLTAKTYEIARLIPPGHVTTYGHIARLAGYPNHPRHVGNALKALPEDSTIPWQRVINAKGQISPRGDAGLGVARQKDLLEAEGVQVNSVMGGGEVVDLRRWGWFPEHV
ncbi:methylated-DNA-protein-cysteine methyltransferase [Tremella mesenterica]|uniref:Methylated-DNA-protein-cysteine methyltransferase n=1 Tax=Tremella mesenterica TaxID=5217 RepID=A0A4Q1BT21_TREME|nr:methylated-DNA-protein-cysteine methyltransferase [Tremella mesenterica]